ncbi:MAG: hypothetical protein LBR08_11035 [Bacteroidales bacterium]|nr:hypothetical protein [Bacteroidales bacterium]
MLKDSKYIDESVFDSINNDCIELLKLLISSINTCRQRIRNSE